MDMRIDFDRLKKDIEELGKIGRGPGAGISRPSFSPADLEARAWLKEKIEEACLAYREDGAGNQFGRLGPAAGDVVMAGSHIDTVINGGMFDGAAGVLAALECLRRIQEEKVALSKPLEVASFTDEEGNLVGDFLGSRAFTGGLNEEQVRHGLTSFGVPLQELLDGTSFSIESILQAHRDRPKIEAYLELHIEQGDILETEQIPVGIVEIISGKRYRLAGFTGEASHSGTTPFELRRDAFVGLADFALRATRLAATKYEKSLVTIGKVALHPGVFSVIAGKADFTIDTRSSSPEALENLDGELVRLGAEVAASRGLGFDSVLVDMTTPVNIPQRITKLLEEEADRLGIRWLHITSGAGHDAQILATIAESGMIFIPCQNGISHSPEENIDWSDLEKGANLLLAAILRLAA